MELFKRKPSKELNLADLEMLVRTAKYVGLIKNPSDQKYAIMLLKTMDKKDIDTFKKFQRSVKEIEFESDFGKQMQKYVISYDIEASHKNDKAKSIILPIFQLLEQIVYIIVLFCFVIDIFLTPTLANIKGLIIGGIVIIIYYLSKLSYKVDTLLKISTLKNDKENKY